MKTVQKEDQNNKEDSLEKRPRCPICRAPMQNTIDSKTKKINKHLWKTICGHMEGKTLSVG